MRAQRIRPRHRTTTESKEEIVRKNIAIYISALTVLVVLSRPVRLIAQDKQDHHHMHHHYQLVDVGTFGGPSSFLSSSFDLNTASGVLNRRGELVGWADTHLTDPFYPNCFWDCYLVRAFQLQNGVTTDLGALVHGLNSAADGGINDSGLIAGTAENGELDPLIPSFPELRSVLWENGVIQDLGTLPGGYESYSSAINNRGQVVGVASNGVPDANSLSFPGYQTRAFLWDGQHGMRDLGTLAGGTDAIAGMINQAGQVVGWSYISSAPSANCASDALAAVLATGSFIWDRKTGMRDFGGFGGTCTLATDLNDKGQVVGTSNLAGDQTWHAFTWDRATGIKDLGTLGGSYSLAQAINQGGEAVGAASKEGDLQIDAVLWRKSRGKWQSTDLGTVSGSNCAFALSINDSRQVVGTSGTNCTLAFLWEDAGPMVDLNALVSSNSGIQVQTVSTINNRGDIAANGMDANGNSHALLLIPCDQNHAGIEGCDYSLVDADAAARENPVSGIQKPATTAPRTNDFGRMPGHRLGPLSHIPIPITDSVHELSTPISRDSDWQLQDKLAPFVRVESAADSSSESSSGAAQNSCPAARCSLNHTNGRVCGVRLCHIPGFPQPIFGGYDRTYKRVCFYGC
jgi:probable HAF family extracellular repeat protein